MLEGWHVYLEFGYSHSVICLYGSGTLGILMDMKREGYGD